MTPFKDVPIAHKIKWHGEEFIKFTDHLLDRGPECPEPDEFVLDIGLVKLNIFFPDRINNQ